MPQFQGRKFEVTHAAMDLGFDVASPAPGGRIRTGKKRTQHGLGRVDSRTVSVPGDQNLDPNALRAALDDFVSYRRNKLKGDEKGEAQLFLERLFIALGHGGVREAGATLEDRIKKRDQKGTAFADLMWKPRCLIEMKKAGTDLNKHYRQAFDYWIQAVPDRPRYVILCNFDEFWVYDFDNQLDEPVDRLLLDSLPMRSEALAFMLPAPREPIFGNDLVAVTREAAADVSKVIRAIIERGVDRTAAQRFGLQCVMSMFSEDIGLLPEKFFSRAVHDARDGADCFDLLGNGLFKAMDEPGVTAGGRFRGTPYFNGGLFKTVDPLELVQDELTLLREACRSDWSKVRPEIFGTLFEGSLDAGERHALGAHFTSQADISKVVGPSLVGPWRERIESAPTIQELQQLHAELSNVRVLDPACGSGNFLYVAYRELRRLEQDILNRIDERRRVSSTAAQPSFAYVTPDHFYGLDVNPFAVEIAKVTMMLGKKLASDELDDHQVVLPLDNLDANIVCADALFSPWPTADAIIGNPPYMGRRKMQRELGADYVARLAEAYPGVGGVSDFVTYWFPLAHDRVKQGGRVGFVATNTIRQNASRSASLDYVVDHGGTITDAVASQPWSGDANVSVSIVNWVKGDDAGPKVLWLNDGNLRLETPSINSSLAPHVDVRRASRLTSNTTPQVCFQGQTPGDVKAFVLTGEEVAAMAGSRELRYVAPFLGGTEMLSLTEIADWVIDLPFSDVVEAESEAPVLMRRLRERVFPERARKAAEEAASNLEVTLRNPRARTNNHHAGFLARWWQLAYRREELLTAVAGSDRYLMTSRVQSERRMPIYAFVSSSVNPADSATVFALDDDYSFGILSSSMHTKWLAIRCSTLETRLRYTSTTVWDSFPWPKPTTTSVAAVANAAGEILEIRSRYLGKRIPLKAQYNALRIAGNSPLRDAHERLDNAVLAAYGIEPDADIPTQLLALNQAATRDDAESWRPGGGGIPGARVTDFAIPPSGEWR